MHTALTHTPYGHTNTRHLYEETQRVVDTLLSSTPTYTDTMHGANDADVKIVDLDHLDGDSMHMTDGTMHIRMYRPKREVPKKELSVYATQFLRSLRDLGDASMVFGATCAQICTQFLKRMDTYVGEKLKYDTSSVPSSVSLSVPCTKDTAGCAPAYRSLERSVPATPIAASLVEVQPSVVHAEVRDIPVPVSPRRHTGQHDMPIIEARRDVWSQVLWLVLVRLVGREELTNNQ